jgi:hypothetical protein
MDAATMRRINGRRTDITGQLPAVHGRAEAVTWKPPPGMNRHSRPAFQLSRSFAHSG